MASHEPRDSVAAVHPPQAWSLGPGSSQLVVQVFKDPSTVGAGLSHDHVIVARSFTGTVKWSATDPSACAISISVSVEQLDADPPVLRRAFGLEGELTEKQRRQVKKHMLAKDQLYAEAHPRLSFASTHCSGTQGPVEVRGNLTLRGVTRSVTAQVEVDLQDGFAGTTSLTLRATEYGFSPYSAMLGALKNQDEMRLSIRLVGETHG